jgi:Carbohydrate family 9 binding domain-like/Domain of unknown function (DUF5916)
MNMKNYNRFRIISFFLLLTIFICISGSDAQAAKEPYKIPEVKEKVKIDGILDDDVWKEARVLTLNFEVEPGENIDPPVKTEVLLAYSAKYLYVAFRAQDPNPSEIRARVTDRDNILNDDYVGIVLDTFNDSRRAYQFLCNPYGIQADQVIGMIGNNTQWDAIWNSASRINKNGYTTEIAIPFTSLRFQRNKGDQTWRIDAVRHYPRSLSHTIGLFPRDRSNNCYMCQAVSIKGFTGARPGNNLEFDPTLASSLTQEKENFPNGKMVKKDSKVDPGLTARWSFTPNMTLSAAVNPDFSQVEADVAQLDINNQFALYYPEKRPFFLEGSNIFRSRFYAIYSRTVADPEWGIKLTGQEGKNTIGFFTARDTITNLIIPSSQSSQLTSLDMHNTSTALRYRRDVGKSSTIGAIFTNREGDDYFNRIASLDADFRFTKKDQLRIQVIGSQTRYPHQIVSEYDQPNGKFTGAAINGIYMHVTKNFAFSAHYQNLHPDFRADVGFIDQSGVKEYGLYGRYAWRKNPGHWYSRIDVRGLYIYMTDHRNNLLVKKFQGDLIYWGTLQSYISITTFFGTQAYLGSEYQDNKVQITARARPTGNLYLGLSGVYGDQIDVVNARAGTRLRLNPFLQYNIGSRTYLGVDHVFEKLNVAGGRLYTANLTNLRFVYQFNNRTFLRTILQYANYKYSPDLYNNPRDPEYKKLFSQILFSYKINPRTVLFLGYSDNYYANSIYHLTQRDRTFFLKIGYALVL